jgi:endonuclease YncB( thermonuclease family)
MTLVFRLSTARVAVASRVGALLLALLLLTPTLLSNPRPASAQRMAATVVAVDGSDRLFVQDDAGATLPVQYVGVRGPVRSSLLHAGASAFHAALALGKRVELEPDGKAEEGGWQLRHAYLEGSALPISVAVVAEGWANPVPYPLEHRHRAGQLAAREPAMAEERNLWQPGVQGPAAAWRAPDQPEAGYLAAHPELHPAFDLLYSVPTGRSILNRLVRMSPALMLRDLPPLSGGYADPLGYYIVMSSRIGQADQRSMAAAVAHEATHAIDFTAGAMDLARFNCFELEQRSHRVQAEVWSEFFGPGGKSPPQDDWDRITNDILRFAQRGDLENYVRRSPGYEQQCARERQSG